MKKALSFIFLMFFIFSFCTEKKSAPNDQKEDVSVKTDSSSDDVMGGEDGTNIGEDTSGHEVVSGEELTIKQIQQNEEGINCDYTQTDFLDLYKDATLKDVIVASPVFSASSKLKGFFLSDKEGGEFSGILAVFPKDQKINYQVGDVLTVTGDAKEFYCLTEFEIKDHEKTGEGATLPDPVEVTTEEVTSTGGGKTENFEGVKVVLKNVKVTQVTPEFGTYTLDNSLVVDDKFSPGVYPKVGCMIVSIEGFITYSYGQYSLLPVKASDIKLSDMDECKGEKRTIEDIQKMPEGLDCDPTNAFVSLAKGVTIENITVMSPAVNIYSNNELKYKGYYVSDGSGEQYSGVFMLVPVDVVEDLQPGYVINFHGEAKEYYCFTELQASSIEIVSTDGTVFDPVVVSIDSLSKEGTDDDTEAYEGMYVEIDDVSVTDHTEYGTFILDGKLPVGKQFKHGVLPKVGCKIKKIRGFISFSYGEYKIEPVNAESFEFDPDSDCSQEETKKTISELQNNEKGLNCSDENFITIATGVTLEGVVVVSPKFSAGNTYDGYFISDGNGGEFSGMELVVKKDLNSDFQIGDILTLKGTCKEFYCMTEFSADEFEKTGTADTIEPTVVDASVLAENFEKYEGVLVTIENVEITDDKPEKAKFVVNNNIIVGNLFNYDFTPTVGDTISKLTGIVNFSFGKYKLEPRSAEDIVK